MKTLLSQFCDEFGQAVTPLLGPMREFAETLGAAGEADLLGSDSNDFVAGFRDVNHQLRVLAEKVEEQQAYVLIFGPLKSGKSTLMNAISAAYVSEVTALPAYPCMVYVSHSSERQFVLSRYNGDTQTFASPASMRMQVGRDHAELADRLRREEERGRDFDPALHLPEAIRRVDVRVPAEALADSGAVLVDTPGLYSRMKFGYDRMTREFRDTAACAIFVVKTDNLFLEQVFNEFTELLNLFSRIFLVVNLDSTKMDLRPDGSLAPSLEREDPVRIIQAFETLSMSSPLKAAVDDQRLRIYPVDLLRAASQRLQATERGEEVPTSAAGDSARHGDFGAFINDLTDYLNSTDYLLAFLGDSMRHATHLIDRGQKLCQHSGVVALVRRGEELSRERDIIRARLLALDATESTDWRAKFDDLGNGLREAGQPRMTEFTARAREHVGRAVDNWFANDASLSELLDRDVSGILEQLQYDWALELENGLRNAVRDSHAGAALDDDLARDLGTLEVRLSDFANEGMIAVHPRSAVEKQGGELDVSKLPVRKGLLDWLLLRTKGSIRKKMFGADGRSDATLTAAMKSKRLGETGANFIFEELDALTSNFAPQMEARVTEHVVGEYARTVIASLEKRLAVRRVESTSRVDEIERQLERLAEVSARLEQLEQQLATGQREIESLTQRYGETDPEELVRELTPFEAPSDQDTDDVDSSAAADGQPEAPIEGSATES